MPWLVSGERVLASLEVMDTRPSRRKGLLGRSGIDGAVLLTPVRSVHTIGMRFPIDVMFCRRHHPNDGSEAAVASASPDAPVLDVLEVLTMEPNRVSLPRVRANAVVEMAAGACDRLTIRAGDCLEVRASDDGPPAPRGFGPKDSEAER